MGRARSLAQAAESAYDKLTIVDGFHAFALQAIDDVDGARRLLEAREPEERRRSDPAVAYTLYVRSIVELRSGRWRLGRELAEESVDITRDVHDVMQQAISSQSLALIAALQGDVATARAVATEGLRLADPAEGMWLTRTGLLRALGVLELSLDDPAAALSHLDEAARLAAAARACEPGIMPFAADRVEALVGVGELDAAEAATAELEELGRRLDRRTAIAAAERCRGLLAAARGDVAAAVDSFAAAEAEAERLEDGFELARTLLGHGAVLRRAARRSEARPTLERAVAIFESLGARLWAAKAGRELARLGGRPAQTRALTPTEQQVADLVAAGKTNHEVAQALHLSPKTVEWNLSKIYRKLRVASRAELAAKYASRSA